METMTTKMLSELRAAPLQAAEMMAQLSLQDVKGIIPAERLKKIRTVILTGCGGELYTAAAAKPVFENKENFKGTGMYPGVETYDMPAVEFSRYYCSYLGWNPQRKANHLVVGVDKSGESSRVAECAQRARSIGSPAVTITAGEQTSAEYRLTPPAGDGTGSFYWHSAALYSALLIGLQMSMAKNLVSEEDARRSCGDLLQYAKAVHSAAGRMEEQARAVAEKWQEKGIEALQLASSGQDFATVGWGRAMMIRALGIPASADDLEGWCHVDIFTAPNERIGCIVVINSHSPARSRAEEAAACMLSLGRQVAVITDDPGISVPGADHILTPRCGASWGTPLMQHIPLGFLAAHMARMRGREMRMDPAAKSLCRINDSCIEIH